MIHAKVIFHNFPPTVDVNWNDAQVLLSSCLTKIGSCNQQNPAYWVYKYISACYSKGDCQDLQYIKIYILFLTEDFFRCQHVKKVSHLGFLRFREGRMT